MGSHLHVWGGAEGGATAATSAATAAAAATVVASATLAAATTTAATSATASTGAAAAATAASPAAAALVHGFAYASFFNSSAREHNLVTAAKWVEIADKEEFLDTISGNYLFLFQIGRAHV